MQALSRLLNMFGYRGDTCIAADSPIARALADVAAAEAARDRIRVSYDDAMNGFYIRAYGRATREDGNYGPEDPYRRDPYLEARASKLAQQLAEAEAKLAKAIAACEAIANWR